MITSIVIETGTSPHAFIVSACSNPPALSEETGVAHRDATQNGGEVVHARLRTVGGRN